MIEFSGLILFATPEPPLVKRFYGVVAVKGLKGDIIILLVSLDFNTDAPRVVPIVLARAEDPGFVYFVTIIGGARGSTALPNKFAKPVLPSNPVSFLLKTSAALTLA